MVNEKKKKCLKILNVKKVYLTNYFLFSGTFLLKQQVWLVTVVSLNENFSVICMLF